MPEPCAVFVIDDDAAAAASVAALLQSVGLQATVYHSAEAFLADDDGARAGCLILDVRLGGMDGLALLAKLTSRDHPLPVILISGHADDELTERALAGGAVACLYKPFDGNELCRLVREQLGE